MSIMRELRGGRKNVKDVQKPPLLRSTFSSSLNFSSFKKRRFYGGVKMPQKLGLTPQTPLNIKVDKMSQMHFSLL